MHRGLEVASGVRIGRCTLEYADYHPSPKHEPMQNLCIHNNRTILASKRIHKNLQVNKKSKQKSIESINTAGAMPAMAAMAAMPARLTMLGPRLRSVNLNESSMLCDAPHKLPMKRVDASAYFRCTRTVPAYVHSTKPVLVV